MPLCPPWLFLFGGTFRFSISDIFECPPLLEDGAEWATLGWIVMFSAMAKGAVVSATKPWGAPGATIEEVGVNWPTIDEDGDCPLAPLLFIRITSEAFSIEERSMPESVKFNISVVVVVVVEAVPVTVLW